MSLKIFFTCLACLLYCIAGSAELDIICTTDLHGNYQKMPALAAVIKSFGDNTVKIDVGDTLTGTLLSDSLGGEPMIKLLNALKYDVWIPGNHDFELGYSALEKCVREFNGTVLGIQWHWKNIRPSGWKMFNKNGIKVAVIGATDPAMPFRTLPGIDGVFKDTTAMIEKEYFHILEQKPHVILLAYHNGEYSKYGSVYSMCRRFPGIDVILGGHSHKEVRGKKIRKSYFVQAGALGSCVARIKIKVDDKTDKVLRIESGIFYPDQLKTDPAVKLLCQKWSEMEKLKGKTPVTATEKLYRLPVKKDKFSRLGELGAGALLKTTGADAALFSLREVKKQMFQYKNSQGKFIVNERILFGLFPFTNRICLIEVEKEDLTELEMSIREYTRKQKRRYFCAGALMMDKKGRLESSKPKFTLAVTDYVLTSFPVLRRKLQERGKWSVVPGSFERDIMRNALKSCR